MSPMPEGEQLGRPYCNNCGYSLVGLPLVQVPIGGHGHRWGGVRGLCHYLISGRGGTAIPLW